VVIGLIHALGKLTDGEEQYVILTNTSAPDWVRPYIGPNMQIIVRPNSMTTYNEKISLKVVKSAIPEIIKRPWRRVRRRIYQKLLYRKVKNNCRICSQDGFIESLGLDVIHFPYQSMELCAVPSVFNPHDLQHLHLPEFFTKESIRLRETWYRLWCRYAKIVVVATEWVKNDLVSKYNIDRNKIYTIPFGAPTEAYKEVSSENLYQAIEKFGLPKIFALYPAQTWAHKNHIRLLEAIALLRDRHNFMVQIVCTGRQNDFFPNIIDNMTKLGLDHQVRFLGFVDPEELRALYKLAQFVILPTLFEADSFPLIEAWFEGTPVACSNVTCLPKQAGNAAYLFNPWSVQSIAYALLRMSRDDKLRGDLSRYGTERIRLFSWERTARMYRTVYRKLANYSSSEEDKHLLKCSLEIPFF